jgi:nitric oxide reductase activation protein
MEALIIISSIPSLIEANQKPSDRIRKIERLIEVVLKQRLSEKNIYQIVLLLEGLKIAASLKENKPETKELAPNVPSVSEHFSKMCTIFRPFFYLLVMILRGRNSKLALFVCVALEICSDERHLESYLLRFPVFDKILARILPKFVMSFIQSYQRYITYII